MEENEITCLDKVENRRGIGDELFELIKYEKKENKKIPMIVIIDRDAGNGLSLNNLASSIKKLLEERAKTVFIYSEDLLKGFSIFHEEKPYGLKLIVGECGGIGNKEAIVTSFIKKYGLHRNKDIVYQCIKNSDPREYVENISIETGLGIELEMIEKIEKNIEKYEGECKKNEERIDGKPLELQEEYSNLPIIDLGPKNKKEESKAEDELVYLGEDL